MEKVKNVVPDSQVIYLYKKLRYLERPKGTVMKKYLYDRESDTTYVKVRKPLINKLIGVMAVLIAIMVYVDVTVEKNEYKVTYQELIYAHEGYAGINVTTDGRNKSAMEVVLEYEGAAVMEPVYLQAGASVGNVVLTENLEPGVYDCVLKCSVTDSILPATEKLDVQLIIEEEEDGNSN